MHKYLVFSIPAVAAIVAPLLWLWLPAAQLESLMAEGGAVENWTLFGWAAAIVAICLCLLVTADKVVTGAFLIVLISLAAREMDFHSSLTGTSMLRVSYYLRGGFGVEKAGALATLALLAACGICLWLRYGVLFLRDLRARGHIAVAVIAFGVTAVASKVLDRAVSVLIKDFGFDVSRGAGALVRAFEETLELTLPLIVLVAAVQYWKARRRSSLGHPAPARAARP